MARSIPRKSNTASADSLALAAAEARACTVCAPYLPLGPRPVLRVSTTARLLIIGQAPGTKVHASGTPWTDESGKRLRGWLGMAEDAFYDTSRVAILPMGLCYPGRMANGGDAPPRPECAPLWQARLVALMPDIQLTLLVGGYAQVGTLGRGAMTDRVRHWRTYLPRYFPLPHPSWRTGGWEKRNPWFAAEALPALRTEVARALGEAYQPPSRCRTTSR
jgi:uracil-DNA glycosylase